MNALDKRKRDECRRVLAKWSADSGTLSKDSGNDLEEPALPIDPAPGSFGELRIWTRETVDETNREESPRTDEDRLFINGLEAWRNAVRLGRLTERPQLGLRDVRDFCIFYLALNEYLNRVFLIPDSVRESVFQSRSKASATVEFAGHVGNSCFESAVLFAVAFDVLTRASIRGAQRTEPFFSGAWQGVLSRMDSRTLVRPATGESCPDPLIEIWCIAAVERYTHALSPHPEWHEGHAGASCQMFMRRIHGERESVSVGPPVNNSAYYLGERKYQVGSGPPIVLEESEDHVLRSLIDLGGAASKGELYIQTGKADGPRVLKLIRTKHASLAPYIIVPGARGRGGYRTTILRASPDRH